MENATEASSLLGDGGGGDRIVARGDATADISRGRTARE